MYVYDLSGIIWRDIWSSIFWAVLRLAAQACVTLCDPLGYSTSGSSVYGDSPGKTTGGGCHALLQEIFPTQRWIPGLPHWGHFLYHLSHQGNSRILEWVPYPFSRGIFPTQELNLVSCIAGRFYILWKCFWKKNLIEILASWVLLAPIFLVLEESKIWSNYVFKILDLT